MSAREAYRPSSDRHCHRKAPNPTKTNGGRSHRTCATVKPLIQGRRGGAHNCTSFMRSLRISMITSGISRGRAVMTVATPRRGSAVVKA